MILLVDLDGTIIDSFERHYRLLQSIIDSRNIKYIIDVNNYILFKKNGFNNVEYLKKYSNISYDDILSIQKDWIENIEKEEWLKYDRLYDDSITFLEYLKNENYQVYFLTYRNNVDGVLKELNWFKIKDYSCDIFVVNKNNYCNKENAIKENFSPSDNIVVIGDSEIDYNAAKEVKCNCYILNRGFRSKKYLETIGINKTYEKLNDIIIELKNDTNGGKNNE